MADYRPNSTAMGAALMRVAHLVLDQAPFLLKDEHALALCGLKPEHVMGAMARMEAEFSAHCAAEMAAEIVRHVRASILLRNRFAEDQLERAMRRGVRQYVMLGAGLDTFALRRPELAAELRIIELDLPELIAWKAERLAQMGHVLSARHVFLAGDMEGQSLAEILAGAGLEAEEPVFFSWLGVTGYLSAAAIAESLQAMARWRASVVFSYGLKDEAGPINTVLKKVIAARGEPAANGGFLPEEMRAMSRQAGFNVVEDLSVDAAQALYFTGRADGLAAPAMIHMMYGQV